MSHPKDSIPRFGEIVGKSAAMKTVFSSIEKVASVDYPVLIVGETGTGKDLVAREIHNRSPRSKKPFIPINMSAIPSELVASVLFGHEKGSFTGASESHAGYFQEGKNGTLFLDEISTMDDNVQSALLRVLETKKYRKIGSNKEFKTDSRILAATNQATKILVKSKQFRVDLLHRLQVVQINVPPLRRRKQDIALLVQYFLQVIKQNYDRIAMTISKDALKYLKQYSWPGNVRELRNTIFHAAVLSEGNEIHTNHLPEQILLEMENLNDLKKSPTNLMNASQINQQSPEQHTVLQEPVPMMAEGVFLPIGLSLEEAEKAFILKTLSLNGNNKTQTAKILGISRKTLHERLLRWKITE